MSTRLEDFIRNNREEFDSEEPRPQLWKKLETEMMPEKQKGKVSAMKFLRPALAAAIVIAVATTVFFLQNNSGNPGSVVKQEETQRRPGTPEDRLLEEINPGYAQEVYHFTRLIELKQSELQQIEKDNPELYKQFIGDINKLDSSYNALKKELPANPNREQLLEAMIQNLQLQTDLLNQQLNIIKQIKQSKNNSQGTRQI